MIPAPVQTGKLQTARGTKQHSFHNPWAGLCIDPALLWFPEANGKEVRHTQAQKKAANRPPCEI